MLEHYFFLIFEFLKVGLFTFGGGYASLPFLYSMIDAHSWFTANQLTQMIAISGITPGPIGLNMATFAGFQAFGIKGAFLSSMSLIFPMLIIATLVFKLYKKFSENRYVESILHVLRPTSCALITSVGLKLFYDLILKQDITFKNLDMVGLILLTFFANSENGMDSSLSIFEIPNIY